MKKVVVVLAVVFFLGVAVSSVQAYSLGFTQITTNGPSNIEAQFRVEVTDVSTASVQQVLFGFYNDGPVPSTITAVYFDDGTLLGLSGLIDKDQQFLASPLGSSGVDFTGGSASPGDLPSGNTVGFQTTAGFLADADSPAGTGKNGVDVTEWLGVVFALQTNKTFANVIEDLEDRGLQIGLHVQGIGEYSESFVNDGHKVPEPATMLLFGTGLLGLAAFGRKKVHKK